MKRSTIIIIVSAILIAGAATWYFTCSSCGDACCKPKTSKETTACNSCGKSSCDKHCKSVSGLDTTNFKAKVPSCNLTNEQMAERKELLKNGIFSKVKSIQELPTGYQLNFEEPKKFAADLIEFINFERGCCVSFTYGLILDPNEKGTHLQMYGSAEIKQELKDGLGVLVDFDSLIKKN